MDELKAILTSIKSTCFGHRLSAFKPLIGSTIKCCFIENSVKLGEDNDAK